MGAAQSMVGIEWAFSLKRQSAYATANPTGDIDQTHPFEGTDIVDHVPNMSDNANQFGRGHEFATRLDIMSWDTQLRRTFTATSKILGWAMAFHLGKITSSNLGGSPSAYQHVMEYMDPAGAGYYSSGRQQPVFTVVEKTTSGYIRKFPSMQIRAVELTGQLNDWVRMTCEMQGSGVKTTLGSFTFPDMSVSEGERMRFSGLTFSHGATGGASDISCDVRSFRFRTEYQYFEADGYCPGSGYLTTGNPATGQVRNKLEWGRRAVVFEFTVRADANTTLFTRLEGSTELEATLTFEGATISGANEHKLILSIPTMKYRAVPISTDGDLVVFNVQAAVFYDGDDDNPFTVTVVNTTPAYATASV
jgi:hypothetical protein